MGASRRKKKVTFKFELGLAGLIGLGVVVLCLFLWMFLLGIWAGQTVLQPGELPESIKNPFASSVEKAARKGAGIPEAPAVNGESEPRQMPLISDPGPDPEPDPETVAEPDPEPEIEEGRDPSNMETSFFSLQVGAFKDPKYAENFVRKWKDLGYDAFLQPPAPGTEDTFTRVFVGRYEKLTDANRSAARFEEEHGNQAFIALVPAAKKKP